MLTEIPDVVNQIADQENQAFINAVKNDNEDLINRLRVHQAVINNFAAQNNEALIHAIKKKNWYLVDILLQNANVQTNLAAQENEPVIQAIRARKWELVDRLLSCDDVQRNIAAQKNEPVVQAILARNWELVDRLLACDDVQRNIAAQNNRVLSAAISVGESGKLLVEKLLQNALVLKNIASGGYNVYNAAARSYNYELCQRLLTFTEVFAQAEKNIDSYYYQNVINFRNNWLIQFAKQDFKVNSANEQKFAYLMLLNLIRNPQSKSILSVWTRKMLRVMGFNVGIEHDVFIEKLLSLPHMQNMFLNSNDFYDCEILELAFNDENASVLQMLLKHEGIAAIAADREEQINIILNKPRNFFSWLFYSITEFFGYTQEKINYFKPETSDLMSHTLEQTQTAPKQSYLDYAKAIIFSHSSCWKESAATVATPAPVVQAENSPVARNKANSPNMHS